jgi:hypothetical protein
MMRVLGPQATRASSQSACMGIPRQEGFSLSGRTSRGVAGRSVTEGARAVAAGATRSVQLGYSISVDTAQAAIRIVPSAAWHGPHS